ncbi:MAG: beta-ketoacyl-ACP synthase III [Desulfurella sp.]|jgi:3-oxoacyl-[acyl-carrier-protein] synthase-3
MRSKIVSIGSYLPEKILTNLDLEKIVNTSDEWIVQRTGIKERHISDKPTSYLAYMAAKKAIEGVINPDEIDVIIVATVTPDKILPATALFVQSQLKAKNAFCFDINAACSGFLYALSVGDSYIRSNTAKNVLVIGAEVLSKFVDWTDRSTCVIFGDGAAAVLLQPSNDESGIYDIVLHSDGDYTDLMQIPAGGSLSPCSKEAIDNHDIYIKMLGNQTFKMAVQSIAAVSEEALNRSNLSFNDIDLMVSHQANIRIIEGVAKRIHLPMDKVQIALDIHGNTAAASIPLALDLAYSQGKIKKNDRILLNSFGASLTWGACVIVW